MTLALLDGTNGNIDITLNSASYKTIVGAFTTRMAREFFEQTTFATDGFRARNPGMKQAIISMAGFGSKGGPISDPLALFASQTPYAGVFTFDTGCTVSGNFHIGSDDNSVVAAGLYGRVMTGESYGAFTTAWVVA